MRVFGIREIEVKKLTGNRILVGKIMEVTNHVHLSFSCFLQTVYFLQ